MKTFVLVRKFDVRKTSNGKNYGQMRVCLDRAADFEELDAKIWDLDAALGRGLTRPEVGALLDIQADRDEYKGQPQLIVRDWRALAGEERTRALAAFTPDNRTDRAYYCRRLDELIERVPASRVCGVLLREIFDRAGFREAFFHAPAARDHHQSYPGGLLEHTINVTSLALALADAYAEPGRPGLTFNGAALPIDRPVLIAAGLLHDIGKLETYRFEPLSEVTDAQKWEGHLAISYAWVREAARPLLDKPPYAAAPDELAKLFHCILAHHGQLEFGSPVTAVCAEAFLLSQADMTDARLAEIADAGLEAIERDAAARWARGPFHFRGGIFVGDWKDESKGDK